MDEKNKSNRKFILACYFAISGTAGLFFTKLNGHEFITLATLILGLYAGANVMEKILPKLFGDKNQNGGVK